MSNPERPVARPKPKRSALATLAKRHPIETPGRWLAHYSTADTVFTHILPSGELLMNPYKRMRDPVENQDLSIFVTVEQSETAGYGLAGIAKGRALSKPLNRIRRAGRITSLVRDAPEAEGGGTFGCCWARPRVWEQYADEHRGACLVFDRERFETAVNALPADGGVHFYEDVDYTPSGIADWKPENPQDLEPKTVTEFMFEHIIKLFFTKTDDWSSEHEYRVLFFPPEPTHDKCFLPYEDALEAIVLGAHYPDWGLAGAKKLCDSKGIALLKIGWSHGRPSTSPVLLGDSESSDSPPRRRPRRVRPSP